MTAKNALRHIIQYLRKQATLSERDELELWLEDSENYKLFKTYVKTNYLINLSMDQFDSENSKKQLLALIDKERKVLKLRSYTTVLKYAAIILLFVGIGYLVQTSFLKKQQKITIPPNSITLQLENGDIEILNEDGTSQIIDASGAIVGNQKGQQLVYDANSNVEELVYNTLTVPFGKRFQLQLSDGTQVHLNAGTSIKYPIKFIGENHRKVYLTGEAYFDVTHDSDHPFIVNAEALNVEVLGTEFNVTSYPEDRFADVVLVMGSVGLYTKDKTLSEGIKIVPGTKGSLNKKLNSIDTEEVDTAIYTSWMDGALVFREMSFRNIVKKLERHYNMKIIVVNDSLNNEVFNASFKDEPIENILNYFSESYQLEFTLRDNAIYIN